MSGTYGYVIRKLNIGFFQALCYNRKTVVKTKSWIELWTSISSFVFFFVFEFLSVHLFFLLAVDKMWGIKAWYGRIRVSENAYSSMFYGVYYFFAGRYTPIYLINFYLMFHFYTPGNTLSITHCNPFYTDC